MVAQEILNQLGGNKFVVMTGARGFVKSDDSLSFKLPSNFARDGINSVVVKLGADDTYSVSFFKIRGTSVKEVSAHSDVYADQLQELFTSETGLDTRL